MQASMPCCILCRKIILRHYEFRSDLGVGYRFIHLGKCNCPDDNTPRQEVLLVLSYFPDHFFCLFPFLFGHAGSDDLDDFSCQY